MVWGGERKCGEVLRGLRDLRIRRTPRRSADPGVVPDAALTCGEAILPALLELKIFAGCKDFQVYDYRPARAMLEYADSPAALIARTR